MGETVIGWLDWLLAAIVLSSALLGLFRGFVREAISLLGWFVALWVAFSYADVAEEVISTFSTPDYSAGRAHAFFALIALIGVVLALFAMVNFATRKRLARNSLTMADRVLATPFGALRGGVFVVVMVLLAGLTTLPQRSWWSTSIALPHFEAIAVQIRSILPNALASQIAYRGGRES